MYLIVSSNKKERKKDRKEKREGEREKEEEREHMTKKALALPFHALIAISLLLLQTDNLSRSTDNRKSMLYFSLSVSLSLESFTRSLILTSPFPTDIAFRHSYTLSSSHAFMRAFSCHSHFSFIPLTDTLFHIPSRYSPNSRLATRRDSHISIKVYSYPFILPSAPSVDGTARFPEAVERLGRTATTSTAARSY